MRRPSKLEKYYANWQWSHQVLSRTREVLDHLNLSSQAVEAALENALMRLLLDLDERAPLDLLPYLTPDYLRTGYACVGTSNSVVSLATMDVIESIEPPPLEDVTVEETDGALWCGEFELPKTPPVVRLLEFARANMPEAEALESVMTAGLRYGSIFARTCHIGPPQTLYDTFHSWGVRNEGFASPFNARLLGKEGSGFFSALPRTDAAFGSRGSFFAADHRKYDGAWCIDPPFLTETMQKTDEVLADWQSEGFAPGVIFIVPSSYDVATEVDDAVSLRAGEHYCEGLDGSLAPLPVDVSIYRIGEVPGWDPEVIVEGYRPSVEVDVA